MKDKLSKADLEYLQNHRYDPVRDIARAIGTSVSIVRRTLEQLPAQCTPIVSVSEEIPQVPQGKKTKEESNLKLIVNPIQPGVAVMTKAASEHADEARKINHGSEKFRSAITTAYRGK